MANDGIMEEIRSHLAQDKSSAEVIDLGFKPSSVYKVQSQLRRLNTKLEQDRQLEISGDEATDYISVRKELADTPDQAGSAGEWKKKYNQLESRLGQEVQDRQEKLVAEQKARTGAETLAAQQSAEVARLTGANQELHQKLEGLPKHLAHEVWKLVEPLNTELEELRPLKIWVGHSCTLSDNLTLDHLMCHPLAQ